MKYLLEFESEEEMNAWIKAKAFSMGIVDEMIKSETQVIVSKTEQKTTVGWSKKRGWTDWQLQILMENWGKKNIKWLASSIGKNKGTIFNKVQQIRKINPSALPMLRPRSKPISLNHDKYV